MSSYMSLLCPDAQRIILLLGSQELFSSLFVFAQTLISQEGTDTRVLCVTSGEMWACVYVCLWASELCVVMTLPFSQPCAVISLYPTFFFSSSQNFCRNNPIKDIIDLDFYQGDEEKSDLSVAARGLLLVAPHEARSPTGCGDQDSVSARMVSLLRPTSDNSVGASLASTDPRGPRA